MRLQRDLSIVASALLSFSLLAANTWPETTVSDKVNSWVECPVLTLDADNGKFTVRGTKRPYAETYGEMLREIDTKTGNMSPEERAKKSADIRISYNEKLARAKDPDAERPSDLTFY